MKPDAYTKFILTVIALCLVILAQEALVKTVAPQALAHGDAVAKALDRDALVSCHVSGKGYKKCLPVILGK